MPPLPSAERISYDPRREPGVSDMRRSIARNVTLELAAMFCRLLPSICFLALLVVPSAAQNQAPETIRVWASLSVPVEKIDTDMIAKIRAEGIDRSKIMRIEHYLTDVYGPRPIGSPNHLAAANWAVKTMTSWGM